MPLQVRCKNCAQYRKEWCEKTLDSHDPDMLRDCQYYRALTNSDKYFRHATDEELAIAIAWPYLASPPWCTEHIACPYIGEDITPCDKCALDWLKQEASDD